MFVGHFALGFAAKRAAPRTSLATLFAAAQLADLAWPVLLAAGLEQVRIEPGNTPFTPLDFVSYPYSHSLLTLVLAGVLFAAVYRAATGRNGRMMALLAGLVVSHWALDWVTHRPDLPLYPGGPRVGLGLWNHVGWTIAIELIMFAAGLWVYARATRPRDGIGRWAFLALWVLLLLSYASSIVSPPPPTVASLIAVAMIGSVVIVVLAWWSDSHRAPNDGAR
jgi:hypothetical protein